MSRKIVFDGNRLSLFGTVTLAGLTKALEPLTIAEPIEAGDKVEPRSIYFDFGGLSPHYFDSYRGYYDHLAICFHDAPQCVTAADFLAKLKAADGQVFTGYKGGEFRMGPRTPVWVANHGDCDSTAIVGLMVESRRVTILTEYMP